MTRPFIPFPIFPPYMHWCPSEQSSALANRQVSMRLHEISSLCQPFICIWYVERFINWRAHDWSPLDSHLQYSRRIVALEKMLHWSFANELCLLDWTRSNFEKYCKFLRHPPRNWTTDSTQPRFLGEPAKEFRDWTINPDWALFKVKSAGSDPEIERNVTQQEVQCVRQFLAFYLRDVSATRENVADQRPESLEFSALTDRSLISDKVLNWMLKTIESLDLSIHTVQIISMYLMIARHSLRPMWVVLGNGTSPGRIDQFKRSSNGIWQEPHPKIGSFRPLPHVFGQAFERYLNYMNIDAMQPLPALSLFPKEHSFATLDMRALASVLRPVREKLADAAKTSGDPKISKMASQIRCLTPGMLSSRRLTKG